jgi:hypothetical protein
MNASGRMLPDETITDFRLNPQEGIPAELPPFDTQVSLNISHTCQLRYSDLQT